MKKQMAIDLLTDQKTKLRKPGFTPNPWIDETGNYVALIFGKDSDQYRQINTLVFKEDYPKTGWKYRVQPEGYPLYNDIELAEQFIDSLIEHLNKVGLSRKGKKRE